MANLFSLSCKRCGAEYEERPEGRLTEQLAPLAVGLCPDCAYGAAVATLPKVAPVRPGRAGIGVSLPVKPGRGGAVGHGSTEGPE